MNFLKKSNGFQNQLSNNEDLPKIQLIGFIGAIIMIVGSFLDFVTFSISVEGVNFLSTNVNFFMNQGELKDGLYIMCFAIIIIIFIFKKKPVNVLIASLFSLGVILIDFKGSLEIFNEFKSKYSNDMDMLNANVSLTFGPAFYLCLIGSIIAILYFVLYYMKVSKMNKMLNNSNSASSQFQNVQNGYSTNDYNQPMNYSNQSSEYPNSNYNQNN